MLGVSFAPTIFYNLSWATPRLYPGGVGGLPKSVNVVYPEPCRLSLCGASRAICGQSIMFNVIAFHYYDVVEYWSKIHYCVRSWYGTIRPEK